MKTKEERDAVVCRYKCGTCGHESVDRWGAHQAHYEAHQAEE